MFRRTTSQSSRARSLSAPCCSTSSVVAAARESSTHKEGDRETIVFAPPVGRQPAHGHAVGSGAVGQRATVHDDRLFGTRIELPVLRRDARWGGCRGG